MAPLVNSAPVEKRCVANAAHIDDWAEGGLRRYRIAFSAEGLNPETYCDWWDDSMFIYKPQRTPGRPMLLIRHPQGVVFRETELAITMTSLEVAW